MTSVAALLVLAAVAAQPAEAQGRHVVIRSTVAHRGLIEQCRETVERALPLFEKHAPYKLPAGQKLVINLYGSAEEYAEAVEAAGAGAFRAYLAATAHRTKECYLVVQPRSDAAYLDFVGGLPEQTRRLLVHEALHQWIYRADAPGYRTWPHWYGEGMADYLAERYDREVLGLGEPIWVQSVDWLVLREDREGARKPLEEWLRANFMRTDNVRVAYAHAQSLYRFLAAQPGKLAALHGEMRRVPAPRDGERSDEHLESCAAVVRKVYGPLAALDAAWRVEAAKAKPAWFEDWRSVQMLGTELVCAAFPGSSAMGLSARAAGGDRIRVGFELNILGVAGRQADVVLGARADGFMKMALGGKGYITFMVYAKEGWNRDVQRNVAVPAETFASGRWVSVEVEATRTALEVRVAGKALYRGEIPEGLDPLDGLWGVGAWDDVVRYRNVGLRP